MYYMLIAVLIAFVACVVNVLAVPVFEGTAALFLVTVVASHPLGLVFPLELPSYLAILVTLIIAVFIIQRIRGKNCGWKWLADDYWPIAVWIGAYAVSYSLCLLWPDFISIGERLRDYSILSSVIQHPVVAVEPWMAGVTLNYYLYWYRVGHFLSVLGHLRIWETYDALSAFTFSLFLTALFRLASRCLRIGNFAALGCAVLIAFGSNATGAYFFLMHDPNWWGPSRVIPGAINEFPAWSFLLGDLHPHFLNLSLLPIFVLVLLALVPMLRSTSLWIRSTFALSLSALALTWVFGANAWELPFAADVVACIAAGSVVLWAGGSLPKVAAPSSSSGTLLIAASVLCLVLAFLASEASLNIVPPHDPFRAVLFPFAPTFFSDLLVQIGHFTGQNILPASPDIPGTNVIDLLRHWGFPLFAIAVGLVSLSKSPVEAVVRIVVLIFGYLSGSALLFLVFLIVLCVWHFLEVRSSFRSFSEAAAHMLGIAALLGVLFPEVIFIDDPYGGDSERMNTIFKFYSASWAFLHLYAFALVTNCLRRYPKLAAHPRWVVGSWGLVLCLFLGFFLTSIRYRMTADLSIEPYEQGLSTVNHLYPGAGVVIQKLEQLPRGVVLEAQVGAYDYSAMVSTLSGNEAFLGWANHMQLLTKQDAEVARRQKVTREFYTNENCDQRRATMEKERIRYAVVGTLERNQYGQINAADFACLPRVLEDAGYAVYELK